MTLSRAALTSADVERFIVDGFVRLDDAFPRALAARCREVLWAASGCSPSEPSTWTQPVIRLGDLAAPPFRDAANAAAVTAAFDALVGPGRWIPRGSLGTFPIRFPHPAPPGDDGWHVDMSFGMEDEPDFLSWRVNLASRGRALLALFLFSDVGEEDAPTRILAGSHHHVARLLATRGEEGMTLRELVANRFADAETRCREHHATGPAGTVYLCHPFLVHAAQQHRGRLPRFLAQPALLPRDPRTGATGAVAEAIRRATSSCDHGRPT